MQPTVLRLSFGATTDNTDLRSTRAEQHTPTPADFFIPAVTEFIGTFVFMFLNILSYLHTVNAPLAVSLFDGVSLFVLTCILGRFSGAHFNPAQTLSVIFLGKCRFAIGFFMIFMQFLGAFFGAVYVRCVLQDSAFAIAMHAAMWPTGFDAVHTTNRFQHFLMELTLSTLVCSAYLLTAVANDSGNGALCAAVVAATRATVTFVGYLTIGQTSNLARTVGLASTSYIFLSLSDEWRFIYIPLLIDLASAPVAATLYWVALRDNSSRRNDGLQKNP